MKRIPSPWFEDSSSRRNLRQSTYGRKSGGLSLFWLTLSSMSVTGWLILINVVFFIVALISLRIGLGMEYIAISPTNFLEKGYVWTVLTSMFMHGGIFHLLINMFVLFSLGGLCEKIIGRKRFLWFYLLSGVVAGLAYVFLAYFFGTTELGVKIFGSPLSLAVGASGAIFAIAGLFVMLTPKLKFYIIFLPFFSLPAYIMVPLVLFITWGASSAAGFPIGNTAHFGGFMVGIFYGWYLRVKYKRKTKMISNLFSK